MQRLARAPLIIGRTFGVGGDSWSRFTHAGDGVGSARTTTSAGAITGYVVQQLPSALALALAGANVPRSTWWFVTEATITLGDTIQSATNASLIYTIETMDAIGAVSLCRVSPGGAVS